MSPTAEYPVLESDPPDPDAHFLAAVQTLVGASLAGIGHIAPLQPKLDLRSAASVVADMLAQRARAGSVTERICRRGRSGLAHRAHQRDHEGSEQPMSEQPEDRYLELYGGGSCVDDDFDDENDE